MNKSRKSFLITSAIIAIVACAFSLLAGMFCFLVGSFCDEDLMKKSYLEDVENYTYYENGDDDYYFTYIEDGKEMKITEEDIEFSADLMQSICYIAGGITLLTTIAKLTLSIRVLILTTRNKYAKGCVVALLVLSAINGNMLELLFLILAMCSKDAKTDDNKPLGLNDIETTAQ